MAPRIYVLEKMAWTVAHTEIDGLWLPSRAERQNPARSFRKRVGWRVVFQLEISGKFSEIAEINFANSDTANLSSVRRGRFSRKMKNEK